jgi:hypothetical protein
MKGMKTEFVDTSLSDETLVLIIVIIVLRVLYFAYKKRL